MARVLVTEQIAASGIDALRDAGHDVDEAPGLSDDELLDAVKGAAALIIRSATQVTAEVLDGRRGPRRRRPRGDRARQRGRRGGDARGASWS